MIKADTIVLGAGPAGTSAAITLGPETIVLERQPKVEGLAGSFEIEGAIFDIGGHSFHTPHPEVKKLVFSALEMFEQKREARCYFHGSLIPYPFQKHFRELESRVVVEECARGLEEADRGKVAANLEEHLERRFGPGIARHFLLPYNRKLWGRDLKRLSTDWVKERISTPEGVSEAFALNGGIRKPLQSDTQVAYPARGGFGEITRALAKGVKDLQFGTKVVRVDPVRQELLTEDRRTFSWQRLISTIPVNELIRAVEGVPQPLLTDVARLEYLSLKLVLVVIKHPVDTDVHRIYASEERIPAHKIVINHNSSPYLRSLPHHAITGEVSYSSGKLLQEDLENHFVQSLIELKLISNGGEVLRTEVLDIKYAYPVPTLDRDTIIRRIKGWLEERNIHSIGRFGEWAYINSDEAIYRGMKLGRSLKDSALSSNAAPRHEHNPFGSATRSNET